MLECVGSVFNQVIYEVMWGSIEFYVMGNLCSFDVMFCFGDLYLFVFLVVGRFDEVRSETVGCY